MNVGLENECGYHDLLHVPLENKLCIDHMCIHRMNVCTVHVYLKNECHGGYSLHVSRE